MSLYNLARVLTSTTGTGTITLGSAVPGFLSFANAGVPNGATVSYSIRDGNNSEVGIGTYSSSGPTLTRDTVRGSTNGGAKINLSGNAIVMITPAAEDLPLPLVSAAAQTLSSGEQTQARTNIGVGHTLIDEQIFTSSGTWNKPAGCNAVDIELVGGGGGGGGVDGGGSRGAGGGGGGGYSHRLVTSGLGSTETVTVGAGGTAGSNSGGNGGDGGASSFGLHCSAGGGKGGAGATTTGGWSGGQGGVGTSSIGINGAGEAGYAGAATGGGNIGGNGGSSRWGGGGRGRAGTNAAGETGGNYGGGGGGAVGTSAAVGGAGAGGVVIVRSYT